MRAVRSDLRAHHTMAYDVFRPRTISAWHGSGIKAGAEPNGDGMKSKVKKGHVFLIMFIAFAVFSFLMTNWDQSL